MLISTEQEQDRMLVEAEVLLFRDNAGSMVLLDKGELLVKDRGYIDIDPMRAWQEWKKYRARS